MRTSYNAATPTLGFIHPDYVAAWQEWQTVEDVCEGSATIRDRGELYLPKLSGQTREDYDAYRGRAVFFGATKRTRDAMTGLLMRKEPVITLPKNQPDEQPLLADITMTGMSIQQWIRHIATHVVATGRIVSVIDYAAETQRPYIATYRATDVLNWALASEGGKRYLSLLIVRELEETVDEFKVEKVERFRSYRIENGQVLYKTWTASDEGGPQKAEDLIMMRRGKPLTRIPAVFHNATHLGPEVGEIPLYDIAEINLSHYRTSADLENGRHLAGLPTPWATGVDDSTAPMTLGTNRMMTSEKEGAKFGFLEFTGSGLTELTKALEEKERQMGTLGARMLSEAKKEAEAYDTVRLRAASEGASLANIAGHISVTATVALKWFFWWQGTDESPEGIEAAVMINQDFVDAPLSPTAIQALVQAFQQNAISFDTFFFQLKQGEVYPDGWDMERELAAISQRPVAFTPPAAAGTAPTGPPGKGGPPGAAGGATPPKKPAAPDKSPTTDE